jgi:pyruvate dehydrogenase E1 component
MQELDEGNIWEPSPTGYRRLGNVLWIIDVNRQSLDRVVPGMRIAQWEQQFRAAGWHVEEAKYGRRLQAAFARPGGESLRAWIDQMPNEHYQSLFGPAPEGSVKNRFLDGAPDDVRRFCADIASDQDLAALVTDLAGHDLGALLDAFAACDRGPASRAWFSRTPSRAGGLPMLPPRNHSALLTRAQSTRCGSGSADCGHRMGPARPDDQGRAVGGGPARAPGRRGPGQR